MRGAPDNTGHRLNLRIGKYAPRKYGKYNIHHTGVGYQHLGHEELGRDVLPLCLFAHWLIHGGKMKAKAPWQPNIIQKTMINPGRNCDDGEKDGAKSFLSQCTRLFSGRIYHSGL